MLANTQFWLIEWQIVSCGSECQMLARGGSKLEKDNTVSLVLGQMACISNENLMVTDSCACLGNSLVSVECFTKG